MTKIGILGANGQVGAEVCVYLSRMPGIEVIPVCRSRLASLFLVRCGLDCRVGSPNTRKEASQLLSGCDVVADFTLPRGSAVEVRKHIKTVVPNALACSPAGAKYVYFSSEMAFGMAFSDTYIRHRMVSRTIYGATKRLGERLALRLGREQRKEVYAVRLGQVHGEIQSVSSVCKKTILKGPVAVPDAPTDSVFTFTVAEALANIAAGKETPGLYTLVSVPAWTWRELYEYLARQLGVTRRIETYPLHPETGALRRVWRGALQKLLRTGVVRREMISAYLLYRFPDFERRLTATYRCRQTAMQIQGLVENDIQRPHQALLGEVPGRRFTSLSDSRVSMHALAEEVRRVFDSVCDPEFRTAGGSARLD